MMPWLKNKQVKQAGLISTIRKADGGFSDAEAPQDQGNPGLEEAARSILAAIDAKDVGQLAQALQDAFDTMGSEPVAEDPEPDQAG